MFWYFIVGAVAFVAGFGLSLWYWQWRKTPITLKYPSWCNKRQKVIHGLEFLSGQKDAIVYLYGSRLSLVTVEVEMRCANGQEWLRADCERSVVLPVKGSASIFLQLHKLDRFLADSNIKELTATLCCITPDNKASNPEIKFYLNLERWRLLWPTATVKTPGTF
ncbi:MAG: hypothetical protein ABII72_01475 [Parcubacteria group bacterium]